MKERSRILWRCRLIASIIVAASNVITKYATNVLRQVPTRGEDTVADYQYLSLTLGAHPVSLLRGDPDLKRCVRNKDLPNMRVGSIVEIIGLVTCRQRPSTSTGVLFLTIEDETGNSNVVVWSTMMERYRAVILQGQLLRIKGTMEREGEVIHIITGFVQDMTFKLDTLAARDSKTKKFVKSHDFH